MMTKPEEPFAVDAAAVPRAEWRRQMRRSGAEPGRADTAPASPPVRAAEGSVPRPAIVFAWIVTAALSSLPAIVWTELTGSAPPWLPWVQLAIAAVAALTVVLWRPARPLWRFVTAMAALILIFQATPFLASALEPLARLGQTALGERMVVEQTGKLIAACAMIALLLALGLDRRRFFLAVGDMDAPMRPARLLGFPHPDPWWKFGLIWGFGIAGVILAVQWLVVRPTGAQLVALVPMIPAILLFSSVNAFSEEMTYRAPMLATLEPAVGGVHALWQSAAFFGIAHYFGIPSGLLGAGVAVFMGWILSKAMIETRGLFWPWFIHALTDVAIFTFIALSLA
jgi:membrane protease YdiL (CAAX protease family)